MELYCPHGKKESSNAKRNETTFDKKWHFIQFLEILCFFIFDMSDVSLSFLNIMHTEKSFERITTNLKNKVKN